MAKGIKLLDRIIPNFDAAVNQSSINDRAPLGMGFLYRASVDRGRNNLGDAHYIGITSRTVGQRKEEHLRAAKKLGVINPKRIKRYEQENGYIVKGEDGKVSPASPLYAVMRTAMGTRQTIESRSDGSPYFSMGTLGQVSLHALPSVEKMLISQAKRAGGDPDSINMMNYEKLRHTQNMNRGAGGEGLRMNLFSAAEKAISAWVYLKHESAEVMNTPQQLLTRLTQLTYGGTGRGGISQNNVMHYLQTYLKFGDELQVVIDGEKFTSLGRIKSHINAVMRPRGNAEIGGITGNQMREMVAQAGNATITNENLFALYKGYTIKGIKEDINTIQREQAKVMIEAIVQGIQDNIARFGSKK